MQVGWGTRPGCGRGSLLERDCLEKCTWYVCQVNNCVISVKSNLISKPLCIDKHCKSIALALALALRRVDIDIDVDEMQLATLLICFEWYSILALAVDKFNIATPVLYFCSTQRSTLQLALAWVNCQLAAITSGVVGMHILWLTSKYRFEPFATS